MSENRTEISELGEFGLIDRLTRNNEIRNAGTLLSVGDDAAVLDQFGKQCVISTDMLVEGVHFDLAYTPLKYLGYKAVAVNISDLCAMMATPTQITMSLAISNRFSVEACEELYEGIYAACEDYDVDLIGGDTTTSLQGLVLSVTAIGEVTPDQYVSRSGAQVGDLICVSGDLGAAYVGLQLLEREKKVFMEAKGVQPDFENRRHVVKRLLRPEPRTDVVLWLKAQEIQPTSMIDVSDGLSSELLHLCTKSNVGCTIYEDKLPIHEETTEVARGWKIDPTACALSGGEDYELLFTIPQSSYDAIKDYEEVSVIGHVTAVKEGALLVTRNGNTHKLVAQGWNPLMAGK